MWGTAVQVSGTQLVPTSLQKQNFITDTLLTLLASDHVFLIRLTNVEEDTLPGSQGSATMTYIMQKSSDTVAIGTVGSISRPCHSCHSRVPSGHHALLVQHPWCVHCMDCCMLTTVACDLQPREPLTCHSHTAPLGCIIPCWCTCYKAQQCIVFKLALALMFDIE